ncbi:hypothetical protein [Brevibacterium jeotgali]|uniref:Uncharacterized protein n=1 Tax=Brevibacterium jeotgali TaxID=1262550 RepID=A0A2H1L8R5_9MICO|nr:hypothetical protein [Brevibacterium jeotgali]TWC03148.1 hypothetical protein FB108_1862 [Brevibacterium jeotgali]SMY12793.1 hypothetical protein BJEO58_02398 [Brevibacterium jeotgali]
MSDDLLIPVDPTALQDWKTLIARAAHADEDAAVRMAVANDVLVLTVAPLHPHGLGDSMPLVLGMRMLRLRSPAMDGLDVVVDARALLDRFARLEAAGDRDEASAADQPVLGIPIPPAEVRAPWAGISPPRGPWEPLGTVSVGSLTGVAEAGIEEVAQGTPEKAGSLAVDSLRKQVWSRTALEVGYTPESSDVEHSQPIPAGAAFGAFVLGFLAGADVAHVLRSGVWTRLSMPGGHVLVR